jgi:hypothetical protein
MRIGTVDMFRLLSMKVSSMIFSRVNRYELGMVSPEGRLL